MSHIRMILGLHHVVNEICTLLVSYEAKAGSILPMLQDKSARVKLKPMKMGPTGVLKQQ
jgi:hypothetical protein